MGKGMLNVPGGGAETAAPSKNTFLADWDTAVTYSAGDGCYANGQLYKSLQDANLAQDPLTATTYWQTVTSESEPPTAASMPVADAGSFFSGTDAEAVLQEIGTSLAGKAAAEHTHTELTTKAGVEAVLTGEISSHTHALVHELPAGGAAGQVLGDRKSVV